MSKQKTIYICTHCEAQYPKWTGRCLECGKWGTIEESGQPTNKHSASSQATKVKINESKLISFKDFQANTESRISTGMSEVDRVFGGGIVDGSLTLIGGEPGIGKSTLVLQIAENITTPLLYASGEESANQIKLRVDRLGFILDKVSFIAENNIEQIIAHTLKMQPKIIIIDSIQTLYSSELPNEPGSITQVRACTVKLLEIAKQHNIATLIIGHVTKDGSVAGPKTLEHLVDSVMYLEGSKHDQFRILRPIKNRFGAIEELGVFEMTSKGLMEVNNPSELFFSPSELKNSGVMTTIALEGARPFIIEIQALVSKTQFGYPQRKAAGFDLNRLQMLIAVLIKRTDLSLETQDVHLNITGGFKIHEPAADLAVCLSIYSSLKNITPKQKILACGEVGLGGELRSVPQLQKRVEEALRMGFEKIIVPKHAKMKNTKEVVSVATLKEALDELQ